MVVLIGHGGVGHGGVGHGGGVGRGGTCKLWPLLHGGVVVVVVVQ